MPLSAFCNKNRDNAAEKTRSWSQSGCFSRYVSRDSRHGSGISARILIVAFILSSRSQLDLVIALLSAIRGVSVNVEKCYKTRDEGTNPTNL